MKVVNTIYLVRVSETEPHPYWKAGRWLYWREAAIEGNTGPGGWASWDQTTDQSNAQVFTSWLTANSACRAVPVRCEIVEYKVVEA